MVLRDQVRLRDELIEIKVTSTVRRLDMQRVIGVFKEYREGSVCEGWQKIHFLIIFGRLYGSMMVVMWSPWMAIGEPDFEG